MSTRNKAILVTVVVAILGFLTKPNGPLGFFWRPDPSIPAPVGIQLPLFILLDLAESIALGLGASFLIFGRSVIHESAGVSESLAMGTRYAIAWILMNWWAHDSLHMHIGMNLGGLLWIEYFFHFTLIICGIVVARFFLAVERGAQPATA
jgi:hypothetical protein